MINNTEESQFITREMAKFDPKVVFSAGLGRGGRLAAWGVAFVGAVSSSSEHLSVVGRG